VSSQTNTHLALGSTYEDKPPSSDPADWLLIADRATFWDFDELEIGVNCWPSGTWETQNDQRLSALVENIVEFWTTPFDYYSENYPGRAIRFAELGVFFFDGASRGYDWWLNQTDRMQAVDFQEHADLWAAYLAVAEYYQMDGLNTFAVWPYRDERRMTGNHNFDPGDFELTGMPSERCVVEVIGSEVEAIPCMTGRAFVCGEEPSD